MSSKQLINYLQSPKLYSHPVSYFKVIETHISWVLLTGEYAYKIKKPLDLEFLDFTSLEKRKFYCEEELRLGQISAPEVYLDVIPIRGTINNPSLNHDHGPILEYAIKMREFPQDDLLSEWAKKGRLTRELIIELAKTLAQFHQKTSTAPNNTRFGLPNHVHAPVQQNFNQIIPFLENPEECQRLESLQVWAEEQFTLHRSLLVQRKQKGFIRDCHGDLHLANILCHKGKLLLFDRIEFNDDFRWTDTLADLTFLTMDLESKQQISLANQLVNHYLMYIDDYTGWPLLPYYLSYRAMVRAKVAWFRLKQTGLSTQEFETTHQDYHSFLNLAEKYKRPKKSILIITYGFSGSGKTTLAKKLVSVWGAIHISSDVQRKRLFNLPIEARTQANLYEGIYSTAATEKTYQRLYELAKSLIQAGCLVVVDASFLKKKHRQRFFNLANSLKIPFYILHCQADHNTLAKRIQARSRKNVDPSEASLDSLAAQEVMSEPLSLAEETYRIFISTQRGDYKIPLRLDE